MSWSGRFWVELALVCYLLGFGYSVYSLATNRFLTPRMTFLAICAGFLFTTIFLFDRGHAIGRCPITNRFEVLVFMTWSMVLIYLVIGSTYRLSLMGAFTAPVASALLFLAISLPPDDAATIKIKVNPWLEAHTSFSMVACGAFALACIAGAMFLVQEQQLKTRQPSSIFFRLPPITDLSVANSRLLWLGQLRDRREPKKDRTRLPCFQLLFLNQKHSAGNAGQSKRTASNHRKRGVRLEPRINRNFLGDRL